MERTSMPFANRPLQAVEQHFSCAASLIVEHFADQRRRNAPGDADAHSSMSRPKIVPEQCVP